MKDIDIHIKVQQMAYDELSLDDRELVDAAKAATTSSYSPYSRFAVGAAVRLANSTIIKGSNQENAAYPSGICAERVAMFYANAAHPDVAPMAIAIASFTKGAFTEQPITPCGACRQVLLESATRFNTPIKVLLYGEAGIYALTDVRDLLPLSFTDEALK